MKEFPLRVFLFTFHDGKIALILVEKIMSVSFTPSLKMFLQFSRQSRVLFGHESPELFLLDQTVRAA